MTAKPFDEEERYLMDAVESGKTESLSQTEKIEIMDTVHRGRNKSISLRISEQDLDDLKRRADNAGIPYQTLINSVLHRYLSGGILLKEPL